MPLVENLIRNLDEYEDEYKKYLCILDNVQVIHNFNTLT